MVEAPLYTQGRNALVKLGERNGIAVVQAFDRPLAECAVEDVANEEGYVAAWARPGTTPLRCKIKYDNYVRLHRLLTQTNALTVWEMLRDGLDVAELTTYVPADFRAWIDAMHRRFVGEFAAIETEAKVSMASYTGGLDASDTEQKKAFALWVNEHHRKVAAILFAMIGGKDYAPIIWKSIRPRGMSGLTRWMRNSNPRRHLPPGGHQDSDPSGAGSALCGDGTSSWGATMNADHYTYRVTWSLEDGEYLGLCAELPSVSWLAATPEEALSGICRIAAEVVADMPQPDRSGRFQHRRLL